MDYYDIIADSYNELYSEEQVKKYLIIKDLKIIRNKDTILDIAHGTGIIKNIFDKNEILGLDNSKKLLLQSNCKTLLYDFNDLPFSLQDNSIDHSLCISAVHHHNNPYALALEMKRLSRKSVIISLLKKSMSFENIKKLLISALGEPTKKKDAYQDILLIWQI